MTARQLSVAVALLLAAALVALFVYTSDPRMFIQPEDDFVGSATACPGGDPQAKGDAALAMIAYPWRTLDYRVSFEGPRKGYLAITHLGHKTITVFVRPCQAVDQLATVVAHELGHAIDDRYLSPKDRGQIMAYRGLDSRPWFPTCTNVCSDYSSPAGDWAEVVAFLIGPPGRFRSTLNGPPSPGPQTDVMRAYLDRRR